MAAMGGYRTSGWHRVYVVQNTAGVELGRVDSAAHHEVPFGPDHLHVSPTEHSKNVVPSFTFGLPQMDARSSGAFSINMVGNRVQPGAHKF